MKLSSISQGLVVTAALALSCAGAFAGELHALSESEMSSVYGQGLGDPALSVLGQASQQGGNAQSAAAASDALSGLGALAGDLQNLDRQLTQQRLQNAASGMQTTLKITQTMLAVDKALTPIASNIGLGMLAFPMFGLAGLAGLDALPNKH